MNAKQIYELGVKLGINADPRGKTGVERWINLEKKKFEKTPEEEREFFDKERLKNPYADTRFYCGDPDKEVKTVLAGIDIEVPEIALINSLQQKTNSNFNQPLANKIDLIITHHPQGRALAALDENMQMMADMMMTYGVPINIAEGVMRERMAKIKRVVAPENHYRSIDAAKMADYTMFNMHTPCDNLVFEFLQNLMENPPTGEKPETLGEIIELLLQVPEYRVAALQGAGPVIFAGSPENRAGRIVAADITGGTSPAKEVYPELVRAGIGTTIGMHMNEESREEAIKNHLNIVIAGHLSSDSLGMNLYLDELEKQGIEIIPISGLIRVSRIKSKSES